MNRDEIRSAVVKIIGDIVPDEDLSGLKDDVPFADQIELDSMDFLDIVMELLKRYNIEVPEDQYEQLVTMESTINYLEPHMTDM